MLIYTTAASGGGEMPQFPSWWGLILRLLSISGVGVEGQDEVGVQRWGGVPKESRWKAKQHQPHGGEDLLG